MPLGPPSPDLTIVVTGASSGIGKAIATDLCGRGYGVTLVARRADRLEQLVDDLTHRFGTSVHARACDLADAAARSELINELNSNTDIQIVGLVNNAGFGLRGDVSSNAAEREAEMVELNVTAVHHLTTELLGGMLDRGNGAILNTASTAAFQPVPGFATYAATKAFVLSFSEALSVELAGTGVSCTALCPGPVKTEFSEVAGSIGFEDSLPSFTLVSPEEVARQAVDAMQQGRRELVPGLANRVQSVAGRLSPRSLVLPVTRRMMK
jgi:short-subunit dehydrogenase